MTDTVLKQLAELERMDVSGLKTRWRALFGTEPPAYNRTFLVKRLSYRVQELAYGGLSRQTRERLDRILDEEGYDELGRPPREKPTGRDQTGIVPGTTLIRYWGGQRHVVIALGEGFEYHGQRFRSLSAVARKITGTNWSGPVFFGLKGKGRKAVETREAHGSK